VTLNVGSPLALGPPLLIDGPAEGSVCARGASASARLGAHLKPKRSSTMPTKQTAKPKKNVRITRPTSACGFMMFVPTKR
jgi:hypothetical protein